MSRYLRAIVLGFLLSLLFVTCVVSAHAQSTTTTSIPFTSNRGLLMVDVVVENQHYTMVFDTGAERTMVDIPKNVEHRTTVSVGDASYMNFPVLYVDLAGSQISKAGARGVLGQDFMRKYSSVSVNYKTNTIELTK